MKIRIDGSSGKWSVFVEDPQTPGSYMEITPESIWVDQIAIDDNPPKDGFVISFIGKPVDGVGGHFASG